ncbi:hypothetical protein Avbf_10585 [Armadillidium vulgare]|nr:hypothetical protein Avbf_10585 [Armadillidium vulgare]
MSQHKEPLSDVLSPTANPKRVAHGDVILKLFFSQKITRRAWRAKRFNNLKARVLFDLDVVRSTSICCVPHFHYRAPSLLITTTKLYFYQPRLQNTFLLACGYSMIVSRKREDFPYIFLANYVTPNGGSYKLAREGLQIMAPFVWVLMDSSTL